MAPRSRTPRAEAGGRTEAGGARAEPYAAELEASIQELLARRAPTSTICPSDAARAVGGEEWRALMEPARQAARRLVERGEVVITQKGEVVDLDSVRGPIRIRRVR